MASCWLDGWGELGDQTPGQEGNMFSICGSGPVETGGICRKMLGQVKQIESYDNKHYEIGELEKGARL